MSNHAIEPWKVKDRGPEFMPDILDATGALVAVAANEDARRIIACVNACVGIPTDELEHSNTFGGIKKTFAIAITVMTNSNTELQKIIKGLQ